MDNRKHLHIPDNFAYIHSAPMFGIGNEADFVLIEAERLRCHKIRMAPWMYKVGDDLLYQVREG